MGRSDIVSHFTCFVLLVWNRNNILLISHYPRYLTKGFWRESTTIGPNTLRHPLPADAILALFKKSFKITSSLFFVEIFSLDVCWADKQIQFSWMTFGKNIQLEIYLVFISFSFFFKRKKWVKQFLFDFQQAVQTLPAIS